MHLITLVVRLKFHSDRGWGCSASSLGVSGLPHWHGRMFKTPQPSKRCVGDLILILSVSECVLCSLTHNRFVTDHCRPLGWSGRYQQRGGVALGKAAQDRDRLRVRQAQRRIPVHRLEQSPSVIKDGSTTEQQHRWCAAELA